MVIKIIYIKYGVFKADVVRRQTWTGPRYGPDKMGVDVGSILAPPRTRPTPSHQSAY